MRRLSHFIDTVGSAPLIISVQLRRLVFVRLDADGVELIEGEVEYVAFFGLLLDWLLLQVLQFPNRGGGDTDVVFLAVLLDRVLVRIQHHHAV